MISVSEILAAKRDEIARLRHDDAWMKRARRRARFPFAAVMKAPGLSVIAEIKRSSPSTGEFGVDVLALRAAYLASNVDALSILSDRHFGMSASDFENIAADVEIPVLRKDFIMSREQILEADILGADAVLLIATFLEREELVDLGGYAEERGLDVLYEAHSREDLLKIPGRARMIGINNRNLSAGSSGSGADYETDVSLSRDMLELISKNVIRVAESGYDRPGMVPSGYDAVLVGAGLIREFKKSASTASLVAAIKDEYSRSGNNKS